MALINPPPQAAVESLSKAKVKLMLKKDCAFFSTLILQSPVHWVTADEVPTAATDGINLFFNPDFFMSLDNEEKIFLLLHEIMHNVYDHGIRKGFRDHELWNKAGDYVINDELIKRNFKMPKNGLHNVDYRDMSADEIYADLMQKQDEGKGTGPSNPWPDLQDPGQDGDGDGNQGNGGNGIGGIPKPTAAQAEEHNKDLLASATQISQMSGDKPGTIPGELERHLEDLLNPKLPWTKILAKFLFSINKNDYSWRKPNRRFISQNIVMPSLYSEGIGRISFAIDTSGSVSVSDFNRFMSEIAYVFKNFQPKEINVMQFDHQLQGNDQCCSVRDFMQLEFKGGGGTNIDPVLEVFKDDQKSKALIILTDGYLHQDIRLDPKKPVIWCVYSNPSFKPLFGTVVHFDN